MKTITGKIKKIIYQSDNGYIVALFRITETNDSEMTDYLNKTITVTGVLLSPNEEQTYILEGNYINNPKFGYQYNFKSYEVKKPSDKDAVIEYLSSSIIKGCGEKTAKQIAETLGDNAIDIIKKDPASLLKVPKMTVKRQAKIYQSIMENTSIDDLIIDLKKLGFSINECSKIIKKFETSTNYVIENNLYLLSDIIDFHKLDNIYCLNNDPNSEVRKKACILETLKDLSFSTGDTYSYIEEISEGLSKYSLELDEKSINSLIDEEKVIKEEDRYYLFDNWQDEASIAGILNDIDKKPLKKVGNIDEEIKAIEYESNIKYNEEQKNAIRTALNNRITIISGGPGTGKTTIINAITRVYIAMHHLNPIDIYESIALIAPTGRASKKMAISTKLPASTIHRYLKWNKDTNKFGINEYNPNKHRLIIIDEVSMIDTFLFSALLKGISNNVQLVLVGDVCQLPSVGAGQILDDLIKTNLFPFIPLEHIYRQSSSSYIPYLAREIKDKIISPEILDKKDDYNFLETTNSNIKSSICKICEISKNKKLNLDNVQILAPVYKGANGINNLNVALQEVYNPLNKQKEIKIGDVIYRENDKVLQLVNNPDLNVYNGDIGFIARIEKDPKNSKKDNIIINFDGNYVTYTKEDMQDIIHAYAITIHKSQGSEFDHVIIPIESHYQKMLYNKLIYTAVSRAKKSLVIVGESSALKLAIENEYSTNRKTTLKEKIMHTFNK